MMKKPALKAVSLLLALGFSAIALADNETTTVPLQMIAENVGYQPGVTISVAGGPPSTVIFDTGSTGLYIFASQVGNLNLRETHHPVTYGYGDGERYEGELVYAPVTIGGVTTQPIPIVVVKRAYCSNIKPDCPVKNDDPNNPVAHFGIYGTMGVGMTMIPKDKVYSPLRALPGNYGNGFIIQGLSEQGGSLVLGLTPNNTAGFSQVQLPQKGTYPDGSPMYDDKSLMVQYTIAGRTKELPTAFDTGGNEPPHFFSDNSLGFPEAKKAKIVPAGKNFEAILENGFDWSFVTTKQVGPHQVKFKPKPANAEPWFNTGVGFFYQFDVLYDYANGKLGFQSH
jgi:hypothetical protein